MITSSTKTLSAMLLAASMCCTPVAQATVKTIELPPDGVQMKASNLPGYTKAAVCAACHSAEYMQYQPATAARPYWEAMVKRMKLVFKAPINDADIPDIVDYLNQTYGAGLVK
jgi:sulfite dehydrogenase (cytochrome) subunit B